MSSGTLSKAPQTPDMSLSNRLESLTICPPRRRVTS